MSVEGELLFHEDGTLSVNLLTEKNGLTYYTPETRLYKYETIYAAVPEDFYSKKYIAEQKELGNYWHYSIGDWSNNIPIPERPTPSQFDGRQLEGTYISEDTLYDEPLYQDVLYINVDSFGAVSISHLGYRNAFFDISIPLNQLNRNPCEIPIDDTHTATLSYFDENSNTTYGVPFIILKADTYEISFVHESFLDGYTSNTNEYFDSSYYNWLEQNYWSYYTGYAFPGDSAVITKRFLSALTQDQIILIRNEVYARHGYQFNTDWIREYFEQQEWYDTRVPFDESKLNKVELENIKIILNYEVEMGWKS